MTTEEMRKALDKFCTGRVCTDCPLESPVCKCGSGYYPFMIALGNSGYMTDEEIMAAYSIAFREVSESAPTIKDSGERRWFTTGAVRDMSEGKGRFDLLPWAAVMEVAKHCENGAKKYGEHNVDKGIPLPV